MSFFKKHFFSLVFVLLLGFYCCVSAENSGTMAFSDDKKVNGQQLLQYIVDASEAELPPSYKYINVLYSGIATGTEAYDTLQKAIYLDIIPNQTKRVNLTRFLNPKSTQRLIQSLLYKKVSLKDFEKIRESDLPSLLELIYSDSIDNDNSSEELDQGIEVLQDVYTKLRENYLYADEVTDKQLIYGAIQGMTQAVKDSYTVYFPPSEAQGFSESIQGEFFGIGAYIEMIEPGKLIIVSPIEGTPAELSGLLPGDQILQIDNEIVTEKMDVTTAVSKIKGPENTTVQLTIRRENQEIVKNIVRKKVVISPISLKELSSDKVLLSISMFQFGLDALFTQAIEEITQKGYQTIIIDLRNNPGGSLDDVEHMLDYIVPVGEVSLFLKTKHEEVPYYSQGVSSQYSIRDKKIIILLNKGSASASEIMAGVIKEYGTNVTIVGETSFGKGTVQSLRDYDDQSSIKITVAKRLMGKSKISIDKIGVLVDKEIIDNPITEIDEVMEYAKSL